MSRSAPKVLSLLLATLTVLPHVGVFSHVHADGTRAHVHIAPDSGGHHEHSPAHNHDHHHEHADHHPHGHHRPNSNTHDTVASNSSDPSVREAEAVAAHWHAQPPVLIGAVHALPQLDVRLFLAEGTRPHPKRPRATPLRGSLARGPPSLSMLA